MVSGTERSDLSSWLQKRARQHTRLMQGQAMAAAAAPASPAAAPAAGRVPGFSPHRRQPLLPPPPSPGNDTPLSGITARTRDPGCRQELRAAVGAGGGCRRCGEKPPTPDPAPGPRREAAPSDAAGRRHPSRAAGLAAFPGTGSTSSCAFQSHACCSALGSSLRSREVPQYARSQAAAERGILLCSSWVVLLNCNFKLSVTICD